MKCYIKNKEKQEEVSSTTEKTILNLTKNFHIKLQSSYGFDANSDNGIQDMSYSTEYQELIPENFIVEDDNIVGYKFISSTVDFEGSINVEFDGTKETLIYSWDDSKYGGSTDFIDKGSFTIVKK